MCHVVLLHIVMNCAHSPESEKKTVSCNDNSFCMESCNGFQVQKVGGVLIVNNSTIISNNVKVNLVQIKFSRWSLSVISYIVDRNARSVEIRW